MFIPHLFELNISHLKMTFMTFTFHKSSEFLLMQKSTSLSNGCFLEGFGGIPVI